MNPAAAFFFGVLVMQAVFTAAVVLLVGRRFPARVKLYRWLAPAALPVLLFVLVSVAYVRIQTGYGLSASQLTLEPIAKLALAYAVLWLIGVLFAGMLIRLVLKRR